MRTLFPLPSASSHPAPTLLGLGWSTLQHVLSSSSQASKEAGQHGIIELRKHLTKGTVPVQGHAGPRRTVATRSRTLSSRGEAAGPPRTGCDRLLPQSRFGGVQGVVEPPENHSSWYPPERRETERLETATTMPAPRPRRTDEGEVSGAHLIYTVCVCCDTEVSGGEWGSWAPPLQTCSSSGQKAAAAGCGGTPLLRPVHTCMRM